MKTDNQQALFRLIQSMSTAERSAFKKQQHGDTYHMKLYDWLCASHQYEPVTYKEKLKGLGCKRSYSNVKQYLKKQLENFMLDHRMENSAPLRVMRQYAMAFVYKNIGMMEYAIKLLEKVKEDCRDTQQYDLLARAIRAEQAFREQAFGYWFGYDELFREHLDALEWMKTWYLLSSYGSKMNHYQITKLQKEYAPEKWLELKEEVDSFLDGVDPKTLPSNIKVVYHRVMGLYWSIELNQQKSEKEILDSISLCEVNPELLNNPKKAMCWQLYNSFEYSSDIDFHKEILPRIKKLLTFGNPNQPLYKLVELGIALWEINLAHNFSKLPVLEQQYLELKETEPYHWMTGTLYLLSVSFKKTGDDEKASHYLLDHLDLAKVEDGGTQEAAGRIMQLLFMMDEGNDQLLYHRLNTYKQFVINQEVKSEFESTVIHYIQKWLKTSKSDRKKVFGDFKIAITEMDAPERFSRLFQPAIFNMLDWLQAGAEGVSYAEYLDSRSSVST